MSSLFHNILSQIQEKISKETSDTETVARIISDILHTTITPDQITIRDTTLRIKAAPTIKMTLMLQQQKILQALQAGGFKVTTIY